VVLFCWQRARDEHPVPDSISPRRENGTHAKGGDRDQRFIEWPLLKIYGTVLAITLAGIVYAFVIHLQGDSIAYDGLALA
jgi:hypothetical protein